MFRLYESSQKTLTRALDKMHEINDTFLTNGQSQDFDEEVGVIKVKIQFLSEAIVRN